MDIAAPNEVGLINKQHLVQLIELGLVEMRDDVPYLTHCRPRCRLEGLADINLLMRLVSEPTG